VRTAFFLFFYKKPERKGKFFQGKVAIFWPENPFIIVIWKVGEAKEAGDRLWEKANERCGESGN